MKRTGRYHFKWSNISGNEANGQRAPPVMIPQEELSITSMVSLPAKAVYPASNPERLSNGIKKKLGTDTNLKHSAK